MTDATNKTGDGGSAFPHNVYGVNACGERVVRWTEGGMSLRDWFAGRALAVLADSTHVCCPKDSASYAYSVADAMLAERAKGTP
jgi:hypothetical protein